MTPRRTVLASAAALTVLSASGCRTSGLFAGPDPLSSAPPLAADTQVLQAVIAAETRLVSLYRSALPAGAAGAHNSMLRGLLGEHEQHLAQLRAWLVVPPGAAASASAAVASPGASAASGAAPARAAVPGLTQLKAAEQQSSLVFLQYLGDVGPALAQLFASIAASDFTHQNALSAVGAQ